MRLNVLLLALVASCQAFSLTTGARVAPALRRATVPCAMAAEDDERDDKVAVAQEKRLRAERLALEAERAALEAERMSLEAKAMALDSAKEQPAAAEAAAEAASPGAAADVAEATAAPPATTTGPSEAAESSSGSGWPLSGIFNLSASNASEVPTADEILKGLPPPPPLTYGSIAEMVDNFGARDDPAALQLSDAQVALARERVFDLESYYVMKVDQTFLGTIFRGNLRSNSTAAFAKVQARAAELPELSGVSFLLLDDPISPTLEDLQRDGGADERRPVFLAIPTAATVTKQGALEVVTSLAAVFATIVTTLGFALSTYLLADGGRLLEQLEQGDTAPLDAAAPIAFGIGALFAVHEIAHLLAARKHDLKVGVPVPLPSLQLGLFGCITRLCRFAPNRQALFDFAFAGPVAGGLLSFLVYCVGIVLSINLTLPPAVAENLAAAAAAVSGTPEAADAAFKAAAAIPPPDLAQLTPVVPSSLLESSLLLGAIATALLPDVTSSPAVALHPLAVVGFVGTLVNALQLLPIGKLDGGRVALAVLGQGTSGILSGTCLLLVGLSTIFGGDNPILVRARPAPPRAVPPLSSPPVAAPRFAPAANRRRHLSDRGPCARPAAPRLRRSSSSAS